MKIQRTCILKPYKHISELQYIDLQSCIIMKFKEWEVHLTRKYNLYNLDPQAEKVWVQVNIITLKIQFCYMYYLSQGTKLWN